MDACCGTQGQSQGQGLKPPYPRTPLLAKGKEDEKRGERRKEEEEKGERGASPLGSGVGFATSGTNH